MKRKTVSLCLIARDEEATIGTAIKSVLALVDEVIVVDTGSRDNTRIIAEGYGARVLEVPWTDDFAAARNAGLDEAVCDWVLVLDADECLQPCRPVEFQRYLHDPRAAGYRVRVVSPREDTAGAGRRPVRLFRNAPAVRYRFPIHEEISPALESWGHPLGLQIVDAPLAVVHDGETPERRARRRERNLRILAGALETHPREPYFPYRHARENTQRLEDEVLPVAGLGEALSTARRAWGLLDSRADTELRRLHWLPDLGVLLAGGLLTLGRTAESRTVLERLQALLPDHPRVLLQNVATALQELRTDGEAQAAARAETLRRDLERLRDGRVPAAPDCRDRRVRDLHPLRYLGDLALLAGDVTAAAEHYEQALAWDPNYSFGWLGLAECSRYANDRKRAMKLYLRAVTESEWNHRAWFRGGDLMADMGFHDNAASWLRTACTRFPEHPRARRDREEALAPTPEQPASV